MPQGRFHYRAVFQALPQPVMLVDSSQNIIELNKAAAVFLAESGGVAPLGKDIGRFMPWFDGRLLQQAEEVVAETVWPREDGDRYYRVRVAPLHEADAAPLSVVMVTDLTENRRILMDRLRMGAIVEFSSDAIIAFDLEGLLVSWNPGAEALYGYGRSEVLGRHTSMLLPEEQEWEATFIHDRVLGEGEVVRHESMRRRKDGSLFPVSLTVSPVRDASGNVVGGSAIARDITDRWTLQKARARYLEDLQHSLLGTVKALSRAAGLRDSYTAEHQQRVARIGVALGQRLGLEGRRLHTLETACLLHDIGKIAIPAEVLVKPTRLSDLEMQLVREHSMLSWETVQEVPFSGPVAEIILQHHERIDGSGYPRGISGQDILFEARILAVADVLEAMSSHRPYRAACGEEAARAELVSGAGIRYDAEVVYAMCQLLERPGLASLLAG